MADPPPEGPYSDTINRALAALDFTTDYQPPAAPAGGAEEDKAAVSCCADLYDPFAGLGEILLRLRAAE